MLYAKDFDWEAGGRQMADLASWRERFDWIEEPSVSPDGKQAAAVAKLADDDAFTVCVNGEDWPQTFEKVWNLRHAPDGP